MHTLHQYFRRAIKLLDVYAILLQNVIVILCYLESLEQEVKMDALLNGLIVARWVQCIKHVRVYVSAQERV